MTKTRYCRSDSSILDLFWTLKNLYFEFVSNFDIRISDSVFIKKIAPYGKAFSTLTAKGCGLLSLIT